LKMNCVHTFILLATGVDCNALGMLSVDYRMTCTGG
jgi:hypothetical protein